MCQLFRVDKFAPRNVLLHIMLNQTSTRFNQLSCNRHEEKVYPVLHETMGLFMQLITWRVFDLAAEVAGKCRPTLGTCLC